jgi:hypothetical protein
MTDYIINNHGNIAPKPEQEEFNDPEFVKIKRAFDAGYEAGKRSMNITGAWAGAGVFYDK